MADAASIFKMIGEAVEKPENKDIVKKMNAVYVFDLNGKDTYTVDLKEGKVSQGKPAKADVTLTMNEEDFVGLMTGKANGQQLFMSGKIKFKGNMGLLMKLQDLQKMAQ